MSAKTVRITHEAYRWLCEACKQSTLVIGELHEEFDYPIHPYTYAMYEEEMREGETFSDVIIRLSKRLIQTRKLRGLA